MDLISSIYMMKKEIQKFKKEKISKMYVFFPMPQYDGQNRQKIDTKGYVSPERTPYQKIGYKKGKGVKKQ